MITYDFAWVTKFRYNVIKPEMVVRTRELLAEAAAKFDATLIGTPRVDTDFIALRVECSEQISPMEILRTFKGWVSVYLSNEYPEVFSRFGNKNFFAIDYFRTIDSPATTEQLNAWRDAHVDYEI